MSDSVNQHRTFEVLTAEPVRTWRKPRSWPADEKARLVAESFLPGANVSAIARSVGLDPSQLYAWRREALSSGAVAPLTDEPETPVQFACVEAVAAAKVEIVIGGAVVRVAGDIDPDHLAKILRAVRKA